MPPARPRSDPAANRAPVPTSALLSSKSWVPQVVDRREFGPLEPFRQALTPGGGLGQAQSDDTRQRPAAPRSEAAGGIRCGARRCFAPTSRRRSAIPARPPAWRRPGNVTRSPKGMLSPTAISPVAGRMHTSTASSTPPRPASAHVQWRQRRSIRPGARAPRQQRDAPAVDSPDGAGPIGCRCSAIHLMRLRKRAVPSRERDSGPKPDRCHNTAKARLCQLTCASLMVY